MWAPTDIVIGGLTLCSLRMSWAWRYFLAVIVPPSMFSRCWYTGCGWGWACSSSINVHSFLWACTNMGTTCSAYLSLKENTFTLVHQDNYSNRKIYYTQLIWYPKSQLFLSFNNLNYWLIERHTIHPEMYQEVSIMLFQSVVIERCMQNKKRWYVYHILLILFCNQKNSAMWSGLIR